MTSAWIKKLNESDSRLHKEDVIKGALEAATLGSTSAEMFLALARATYNPFTTWGVKQVPVTEGIVDRENPWQDYNELLNQLARRELTGHAARDAIEAMSLRFDSDEWNTFCAPVIRKDLRAGISEKTLNKILKGTKYEVPVFSCQLASDSTDRPEMRGVKRIEKKYDGCRVLMVLQGNTVTAYSRNGKVFENFTHIEDDIREFSKPIFQKLGIPPEDGVVFDGEVIGKSFNELMRQARRKTDADAGDSIFHVFDYLPLRSFNEGHWNKQQGRRLADLEKLRGIGWEWVELVDGIEVDLDTAAGRDQMNRFAQDAVAKGFEGTMIKELGAPYLCKRGLFWMKYKPVHDYDLTVVAVEEGTGRNVGRLGALVCEGTDDGKFIRVNVGSGLTDEQREDYWLNKDEIIGRMAVVLADAITKNQDGDYSLRFPRFKTWRYDKDDERSE